jgi:hypothetical protein
VLGLGREQLDRPAPQEPDQSHESERIGAACGYPLDTLQHTPSMYQTRKRNLAGAISEMRNAQTTNQIGNVGFGKPRDPRCFLF